jgi:hypothetical protein
MELQTAVERVFIQLSRSLDQLNEVQYNYPCVQLSGNTIGQHVRHIIEMFQCLEEGCRTGIVDYEKRERNRQIETDKAFAAELLQKISRQILPENKHLILLVYFDAVATSSEQIHTNYYREIAYNLEHAIHHMALIRVGLREIGGIFVEDSYGVAASTLKYRKQCVQ